jgi:PhzF family phenazine biosynthesis protein
MDDMPPLMIVDAFCDCPFTGNPAAVCILPEPRSDRWMQHFAAEMNLSETAFLLQEGESYRLRWFTPAVEVDLCGHATLASARALWAAGYVKEETTIVFETRSGQLTARPDQQESGLIWLDFPAKVSQQESAPDGLLHGLGILKDDVVYIGKNQFDFLLELADEAVMRRLSPDFQALMQVQARGLIVTARADGANQNRYDFVSRFFAPRSGVHEDPVTGSAHCALGPYWSSKLGKLELTGFQASRRGGFVRVLCQGDRVQLGGRALVMTIGRLSVNAWEASI